MLAVGDLFTVSGTGDEQLVLAGDLSRVDRIGACMSSGRVLVDGPCGDDLGAQMRGGGILVRGDAGAWAGAELAGGLLRITGGAGARLGAAFPGARAGMSGGEIGLPNVTSYISPMAVSWGLSFFGANKLAWERLPADIRTELRAGIRSLEQSIWDAADQETAEGLACEIGSKSCRNGEMFHMNLVPITADDDARRRRLLTQTILPQWIRRCGDNCITAWNETLGTALGIEVSGSDLGAAHPVPASE